MACSALIIVNDFITDKQSALKTVCSLSVVSDIQPEFNFYIRTKNKSIHLLCVHIAFILIKENYMHIKQLLKCIRDYQCLICIPILYAYKPGVT